MAQEEHIQSSSHSDGGDSGGGVVSSDRSRNVKQKKIPQRGLGVAQLEKIRLDEQRKREALEAANALANNAIASVNDAAPCLTVPCPSFGPSFSPSPANFHSPNTLYRSSPSIPIQSSNNLLRGGHVEDTNLQAISSSGNGSRPRLWSSDYNHSRNDYTGAAFRPQGNMQFDTNAAAAPLSTLPQRSFHFQPPTSPVVNATPGISPPPLLTSHMEPPSNQNIHRSNYATSWPEEYKMVGMKRSYTFIHESLPPRAYPIHFDAPSFASKSRFDEFPPCSSSRYTTQTEPRNMHISSRDGPSLLPEQNLTEDIRDDGRLNGDFLTLAPPGAALSTSNSNYKHPLDYSEGSIRNQVHHSGLSTTRNEPFSFFPDRSDIDEAEAGVANANEEKEETVDLNLKL